MITQRKRKMDSNGFSIWCAQQNKKKKALLGSRIFVVLSFWVIVIAYLVSPLSKAKISNLSGNYEVLTEDEIYYVADFDDSTFWWSVDLNAVNHKLKSYADGKYVIDVHASYSFGGIKIEIEENLIVGKTINNDVTSYYLRDGTMFYSTTDDYYHQKHLRKTNNVPILKVNDLNDNDKMSLYEELATSSVLDYVSEVSLSTYLSSNENIQNVELLFSKELINRQNDLKLIIDVNSISKVLTKTNFDKILHELYGNEIYLYENSYVGVYGPIKGDVNSYGFLPYSND